MAKAEIKIPAVGESINEATISEWLKQDGDIVQRDEVLMVLETDKASVEVVAENAGKLSIKVAEGETVEIGTVVGEIDTDAAAEEPADKPAAKPSTPPPAPASKPSTPPPAPASTSGSNGNGHLSPAVNRIVNEKGLDAKSIPPTGPKGNITKADAMAAKPSGAPQVSSPTTPPPAPSAPTPLPKAGAGQIAQEQTREKMSRLRQTIATRLVEAQQTAAILTTFNEIDMSATMDLRKQYKDSFFQKHGVKLGFMGLFTKAVIEGLKAYPRVNAQIDGTDIIYNHFHNIGMAVGTEKGLMVPVIRHADFLSLAEIELSIKHYGEKARDGKIGIDDLSGGTFTISNGGTYGSMMSTPILNPPQSGILGLHKIEQRPVAIDGKVEIRPMMYVALSYDHRMVDGKEAVSFLVRVKECMEDPARMLLEI